VAPSLGALEGTHQEAWGTKEYENTTDPTVFFGVYGFPDFYSLWRHGGRKAILWAGSDITHFLNGYWLDDAGDNRIECKSLARWINDNCESFVENEVEYEALKSVGIESEIIPSFMGNVNDYDVSFEPSIRPKVYTSVSGNDFELYGWDKIPGLALKNKDIDFHLYGNTIPFLSTPINNIHEHRRVPKEQMNREIKEMQGALRLTEFDGFSEIIAKSLLWGQYPVSTIPYPYTINPDDINYLLDVEAPNTTGRDYYKTIINDYPWAK